MTDFHGRFLQTVLLLLALLFTAAVRFLADNDACMTSTGQSAGGNVTVSEVFAPYVRDTGVLFLNRCDGCHECGMTTEGDVC